ncbi:hypothetical protein [Sphingomonas adhaesiva]|uniref:hypothetical protein n=1 Tax=Sphingomonas adhaesiva TaxID=28212 RepID=UPI002FFD4EB8
MTSFRIEPYEAFESLQALWGAKRPPKEYLDRIARAPVTGRDFFDLLHAQEETNVRILQVLSALVGADRDGQLRHMQKLVEGISEQQSIAARIRVSLLSFDLEDDTHER